MRLLNVDVNRENLKGKKIHYWIKQKGIIIIDYGYPNGDIHIYKHIESVNSKNLKNILEKYLGNEDLSVAAYLEIQELIDANELKSELFNQKRIVEK
ncbi:unnamed protein product [marine sediment metagenome]|uniref:Uncharacterized protein n=1 Tax=marine sediment metagenome TaxID=412755 RepID=X1SJW3_9ZZZZ